MAPSDSDNNVKEQFDKYKEEQRAKDKKLKEAKEKGQLSKYLAVLEEINSTLKEMLEEHIYVAKDIIENQGKMTKSLNAIENGINDLNHTLVQAMSTRPTSSATASDIFAELDDQSLFSDDPYDNGEFVAMSENMSDMLTDYYDSSVEANKSTTEAVKGLTDAVTRVVDDVEDFTDELSTFGDAEDGFFDDGPALMSDIGATLDESNDYWSKALDLWASLKQSVESITDYLSGVRQQSINEKNKKEGKTGKLDKPKDKGFGLMDALAGMGIMAMLKKFLNPMNIVKGLASGVLGVLKGFFITIPVMISKALYKVSGWVFKFLTKGIGALGKRIKNTKFIQGITEKIGGFFAKIGGSLAKWAVPITTRVAGFFKSISKFFAPLTKVTNKMIGAPIMKFFGKIVKGFSKFGVKAIPVVGQIWMVIDTLWDFVKGFSSKGASEVTGKTEGALTMWDKFKSGVASAISGFLFGLVDTKKIYHYIDSLSGMVYSSMTEAFNMLPESWKQFGRKIASYFDLSNEDSFISKAVGYAKSAIDYIYPHIEGVWNAVKSVASDALNMVPNSVSEMFSKIGAFLDETILNSAFYSKVWNAFTDFSAKVYDMIFDSNVLNKFVDYVQSIQSDLYNTVVTKVKSFMQSIIDLVPASIREFASSSASFMADKAKRAYNFFAGEDDKEVVKTSHAEGRFYNSVVKELSGIKKELKGTPQERAQKVSRVTVVPQAVNTKTASLMDKQMADKRAEKKQASNNTNNNIVVNNNSSARTVASRNINTGRSDISRSIGRGAQFSFGG